MNKEVETVSEVLQEWRFGFQGGPALQDLDQRYGRGWCNKKDLTRRYRNSTIVKEFQRLVLETGQTEEQAIETLETRRDSRSLTYLASLMAQSRQKKGNGMESTNSEEEKEGEELQPTGEQNQSDQQKNQSERGKRLEKRKRDETESDHDPLDKDEIGNGHVITKNPSSQDTNITKVNTPSRKFKADEFKFQVGGPRKLPGWDPKAKEARKVGPGSSSSTLPASTYELNRKVKTVRDVLSEWRFGFQGGPSIQDMFFYYGSGWKHKRDKGHFKFRSAITREFVRLVLKEGHSEDEAIEILETLGKGASLWELYRRLIKQQKKVG